MDNVEMTLAKSDIAIAARYASLTEDASLGARVHARIAEELERTERALLSMSGEPGLLDDDPVLAKSIRLRNPYVDPMSYVQVVAIRRARESDDDDVRESWERVARAAVQGIAAGLRHTG
jgi:phosphoenolpyruvate carboxylase